MSPRQTNARRPRRLILASQSPRRRVLLRQAGYRFIVRPSGIDEPIDTAHSPEWNARRIALDKAMDVATRVRSGVVVGADTIVVLSGKFLGKPLSPSDARSMLRRLSGRTHNVYSGVAIVDAETGRSTTFAERTRVTFRMLEEDEIRAYVASGAPMDKAGAYGIQDDYGAVFVEKVVGCFYTVVGFPLSRFHLVLRRFLGMTKTRSQRAVRKGKRG